MQDPLPSLPCVSLLKCRTRSVYASLTVFYQAPQQPTRGLVWMRQHVMVSLVCMEVFAHMCKGYCRVHVCR